MNSFENQCEIKTVCYKSIVDIDSFDDTFEKIILIFFLIH